MAARKAFEMLLTSVLVLGSLFSPSAAQADASCTPRPDANLRTCNFQSQDLTGVNLSNSHLSIANLSNTNLTNANLTYAKLSDANLTGANLTGANLTGAYLYNANLSGANLTRANLTYANLSNANLSNANLTVANLDGAGLRGANLTGARSGAIKGRPSLSNDWIISNGYLIGPGANLTGANLTGANLTGANLTGANLTGARSGNITGSPALPTDWIISNGYLIGPGAYLDGANLNNAYLDGANLTGANLTGANLTSIVLDGANLTSSNLTGANLTNVYLTGANLTKANLTKANLMNISSGNITGNPSLPAKWKLISGYLIGPGANLTGANLQNANLRKVQSGQITGYPSLPPHWQLINGYLVGPGADLSGADLSDTNLSGVYFGDTLLLNVNLTNANLSGSNLADVKSALITGNPSLPAGWRLVRGVLVGAYPFKVKPSIKLSGTPRVGSQLSVNTGSWVPKPTKIIYAWFADGDQVSSSSTYIPSADYLGRKLEVRVTFKRSGYNETIRFANSASPISEGVFGTSSKPKISGKVTVGSVLKATSTWAPSAALTYEWFADNEPLNAFGSTLLLTPSEVGKVISVRARGTRMGYIGKTLSSYKTVRVRWR